MIQDTSKWFFLRIEQMQLPGNVDGVRIWYGDEVGKKLCIIRTEADFFSRLLSEPRRPNEGVVSNLIPGGVV